MIEIRAGRFPNGLEHWTVRLKGMSLCSCVVRDGDYYRAFVGRKLFTTVSEAATHALTLRIRELKRSVAVLEKARLDIEERRVCVLPPAPGAKT